MSSSTTKKYSDSISNAKTTFDKKVGPDSLTGEYRIGLHNELPHQTEGRRDEVDYIKWKREYLSKMNPTKELSIVGKDEYEAVKHQREEEELRRYESWVKNDLISLPNRTESVRRKATERIEPRYFKERDAELDENLNLQRRIAELFIRGPKDHEAAELLYSIKSGKTPLPNVPWIQVPFFIDGTSPRVRGYFNTEEQTEVGIFQR